ncbi:cupin domain-containing protein [Erythrobacter litoralis]|nr:cupin domain-containing protein [Erythrobacter litoralis]
MEWYGAYEARNAVDGAEGRLVSQHHFTADWDMWEMHPQGDEVVICIAGQMVLHQERAGGGVDTFTLEPGDYAINSPSVWHTADIASEATAIFITAGKGTQHRPR